jgi:hypothetical protein
MGFFAQFIPRAYAADGSTLSLSGNTFSVAALGVDTAQIKAGAVSYAKLATDAKPALRFVASTTLAAPATQIDFTSLDMNTDGRYVIISEIVAGAQLNGSLFVNGDNTATHYDTEFLLMDGATLTGGRTYDANLFNVTAANTGFHRIEIYKVNGYIFADCTGIYGSGATISKKISSMHKVDAAPANVTQLSLVASGANAFGTGTFIRLYKVATA